MFYVPLPRTLEAALRDIEDKKVQVRVAAAKDLVAHVDAGRDRILAALERALQDSNALVRASACESLGAIRGREALGALLHSVEDEHQLVRQSAILALGEIGDGRAQKRLERALTDERPEIRFQAVMAYPRVVGTPRDALGALVRATRDDDESVVHVAFRMSEEVTANEAGVVDDSILERAKACLKHPSAKVRAVAAVLVGTAGLADADAVLTSIVDGALTTGLEPEDIGAAIELAGERHLQAALPALRRRAFGGLLGFARDGYQWQARVALARLGDDRAKKYILAELRAGTVERRTLAVSAAGRARMLEAKGLLVAMKDRPDRAEPSAIDAALQLLDGIRS